MLRTVRDGATIKALLTAAEHESVAMGETEPGAEHVVLAALTLDDTSAADAFAACGATAGQLRQAIEAVHSRALDGLGIHVDADKAAGTSLATGRGLYRAKTSARDLLKATAQATKQHDVGRLRAAHLLIAATTLQEGTFQRAIQSLGVTPDQLKAAAVASIAEST